MDDERVVLLSGDVEVTEEYAYEQALARFGSGRYQFAIASKICHFIMI